MEAPPQQLVPLDLLLEIAARSDDAATVVRCAAACKPLRRSILEPAFRRHLADVAAAKGGRVPACVMAASFRTRPTRAISPWAVKTSRPGLRFDSSLLKSFQPACSRDGLLLLWKHNTIGRVEFRVCNTLTGGVTSVPGIYISLEWGPIGNACYCPALITHDVSGTFFELLVLQMSLEIQTYSPQLCMWSIAARPVKSRQRLPMTTDAESLTAPVVIRRTVHWLCNIGPNRNVIVLAVHADTAQPTVIELPTMGLCVSSTLWNPFRNLILAATGDGRLGVVVAGPLAISMWTLSPEENGTWSRQLVVDREFTAGLVPYTAVQCQWYGERTGTLLLVLDHVGLVHIDMGAKEATVLHGSTNVTAACLHEADVVSLLQLMKPL